MVPSEHMGKGGSVEIVPSVRKKRSENAQRPKREKRKGSTERSKMNGGCWWRGWMRRHPLGSRKKGTMKKKRIVSSKLC